MRRTIIIATGHQKQPAEPRKYRAGFRYGREKPRHTQLPAHAMTWLTCFQFHVTELRLWIFVTVAEMEFFAASAGAGLVSSALLVLGCHPVHYFGGRASLLDQLSHPRKCGSRVHEKQFQPCAEIVLSRLAVTRKREAVLGAAAIA